MFCPNCGTQLADDVAFCTNCGATTKPQQSTVQQPVIQQPTPPQPQPSMKWFKFLIYFGLWAGAILNILGALPMLTGSQYGEPEVVELVYATFEGLRGLDMFCGIFALALGAFGIYTRFQLAGYKAKAPMLLSIVYAGAVVFNLVYIFGCTAVLPEYVLSEINFTSFYSNTITSAVMIFVNHTYFKKRAHLFTNP